MRNPTMWFLIRLDANRAVQAQKMARGWKFWIYKVEELYCSCSKKKVLISFAVQSWSASLFSHMQIVGFLMRRLKCNQYPKISFCLNEDILRY